MMLTETIGFHLHDRLLRSTVPHLREYRRGEFQPIIPPPNPRQSRLHRDRLGDILRISQIQLMKNIKWIIRIEK